VACLAGDGGTYDIGIQALSGAAERNEDILYVCFDNEAYQNTGNQKSSATPWGARTTSTPRGKGTRKKDIMEIMAAHRIPYAATACPGYPDDLVGKVEKARAIRGTRFINVLSPCVPGWGIPDDRSLRIARLAVHCGCNRCRNVVAHRCLIWYDNQRLRRIAGKAEPGCQRLPGERKIPVGGTYGVGCAREDGLKERLTIVEVCQCNGGNIFYTVRTECIWVGKSVGGSDSSCTNVAS